MGQGIPWWPHRRRLHHDRSREQCSPVLRSCSRRGQPPLQASGPGPKGWTGRVPQPGPERHQSAHPGYPWTEKLAKRKVWMSANMSRNKRRKQQRHIAIKLFCHGATLTISFNNNCPHSNYLFLTVLWVQWKKAQIFNKLYFYSWTLVTDLKSFPPFPLNVLICDR